MRFTLVVIEEHARRAVHLGNDHTLGAVHDEGTVLGHEWHITHEHVLFLDVLHGLRAGVLVHIEHDEAEGDLQRSRVGHVALHALFDVILRLFELVFHEFEDRGLVEILDRKHRLENAHEAFTVTGLRPVARVQEEVIRAFLNLDEVRHIKHFTDFTVELAKTFLAKEGLSHGRCHLSFPMSDARRRATATSL